MIDNSYGLAYDLFMAKTTSLPQNLTVSEARANLYDLVDEVGSKLRSFIISHKGKPTAVVMPVEDLESWEESLEIASNKALMKSIRNAQKEYKQGKTHKFEDVVKELGLDADSIFKSS